jgi:hypothetical protein
MVDPREIERIKQLERSRPRKGLHADALIALLRQRFDTVPDRRVCPTVSMADALMSGFAMFSLKDPSLLAFQERIQDDNMRSIYGINHVPCDSQFRTILDPVDPESLRPCFLDIFRNLQRGKVLERFVFFRGCYLLALDGSQYFTSKKVHCPCCLEKHHRNGTVTYCHQMLGAVLVHPDRREVIPLMPEPIVHQDGTTKNDCERNAAGRFLDKFRQDHPFLEVIVIEDGLASNGPHIEDLIHHNCRFILGAKRGDHAALFADMDAAVAEGTALTFTVEDPETGIVHHFRWICGVALNKSHPDLKVNLLEYWESNGEKTQYFSWVTDLELNEQTVQTIMRGGRTRWKVENETFNTLKNQGYNLEHNYGHGKEHLSVVLMTLMMLAFLVDQVQQLICPVFQGALEKLGTKKLLWDRMRALFHSCVFASMLELYEALRRGIVKQRPLLQGDG